VNRERANQKALDAAARCLSEKGYIAMVDVLLAMDKLTREDYERWRFRQVPHLEKVVRGSLNQLSEICQIVRANSLHGKLKTSKTVYTSWGKGRRQPLRFTKYGNPHLEQLYSTHYLQSRAPEQNPANARNGQCPNLTASVPKRTSRTLPGDAVV
jgi:hypothetical protein